MLPPRPRNDYFAFLYRVLCGLCGLMLITGFIGYGLVWPRYGLDLNASRDIRLVFSEILFIGIAMAVNLICPFELECPGLIVEICSRTSGMFMSVYGAVAIDSYIYLENSKWDGRTDPFMVGFGYLCLSTILITFTFSLKHLLLIFKSETCRTYI